MKAPILLLLLALLQGCTSQGPRLPPILLPAPIRADLNTYLKAPCIVPKIATGDNAKTALKLTRDRLIVCSEKKAAVVKLYLGSR